MGLISNGNAYHGGKFMILLYLLGYDKTPDDLHSVRWRGVSPAILA